MTQLSGVRAPKNPRRDVTRYKLPLAAGVTVYKGADVMVIRSGTGKGYYAPADDAKIGRSVAKALETVTNSGAAGAATCLCEFYRERSVYPYLNDTGVPLTAADREGPAYVLDDQTVSGTVATVMGGTLFEIDSDGIVWVDKEGNYSPGSSSDLSDTAPVDPSSTSASAGSATEAARQDHKHHIALATTSTEGLASAAQITQLGHLAAPTVKLFELQADQALAANTLAEHACLVVATGDTFSAFYVVADSGLTGDPTNNAVLTIKKRDGAGGSSSSMAALTTTANWTAFVPKTFGAVSGGAVAAGSVLTLTIAKGGTGVIVPACTIYGVKAVA